MFLTVRDGPHRSCPKAHRVPVHPMGLLHSYLPLSRHRVSLSHASPLGGLPPPHDTFQGHAAHPTEWSVELRPNGSLGTCIPNGVTTFLLYTSRRTTKKEYARGEVHENRAECLFSLLKPYLHVFRGLSKCNLPGYVGFCQCLRNFRHQTAFEQAELILYGALDPTIGSKGRKGDFVRWLDYFDLL